MIGGAPVVYTVLSVINTLLMALFCMLAVPAVFRVTLRRKPVLWIAAAALCVGVGMFRYLRAGEDRNVAEFWEFINAVLPFVCVALVVPLRSLLKGFAAALGYVFVEAVKYIVMLVFFRAELQSGNDPLELLTELAVHLAAFTLALVLLRRKNEKHNILEPLLQISPLLYVLIVITSTVFMVSLLEVGTGLRTQSRQFAFIMMNIPLFGATVGFAVSNLVKTRAAEKNYRRQLEMQVRHYEMMEKMNEDLRVFRHDLPKKLRPLAAYIENNETEAAKEIMHTLGAFEAEGELRYSTGNYRLDTVLFCEQQLARSDGVRIVYTYGSVFPAEGIAPDDIYTIFPNALDNAIEAVRKVEGEREITVSSRIVGNTVFVTVSNPYEGEVKMRRGVPQTGKENKKNHGYGFRSIKKAAANYGSDNVDAIAENGIFTLRLSLTFKSA